MTKRWSSTRSDLTKTKRQASKEARRDSQWIRDALDDASRRVAAWPAWKRGDVDPTPDEATLESGTGG